ncbi:MAG: glutamate 5-kinase [Candidatus Omnitrophica bacterium]|nr:glutamate 5-kinase [Candidatus Omnitrophota bacterium]MBI5144939.1 glutamate 5-kinase [Candidatus Omnitrophota bacterium]
MKQLAKNYKRIVVKIGASLMRGQMAHADCFVYPMNEIAAQLADLIKGGKEMVVVSSGAIASGMSILKMKTRPKELSSLQATAAVGQHFLMSQYRKFFETRGLNCAQVLLTWDDFDNRARYLNAKNTILKLLELGIVPIINENDTVSTEEIKFGDNDRLSALVAGLVSSDLLIILSDVDGLLDKNKKIIKVIDEISPQIKALACPTDKESCVGGMISKIEAAKIARDSGIPGVIANGKTKNIILQITKGEDTIGDWTLFLPRGVSLSARQRWIAFGARAKGRIVVDDGAKNALENRKSLLSVGVVAVQGIFEVDDIVSIADKSEEEFARGKAGVSSKQLEKVLGQRFAKEIIHCDNIVIL